MIKTLLSSILFITVLVSSVTTVMAGPGDCDGPEDVNKCVNGKICVKRCQPDEPCTYTPSGQDCGSGVGSAVIGPVYPPMTILNINTQAGDINTIGIIYFANRVVLLITIIAGILVMFNFIKAGWLYLLGGAETKAAAEVKDLLTYSIIGLVIIAVTYTIAGLIGLIFFGNAAFILQPTLYSALDIW